MKKGSNAKLNISKNYPSSNSFAEQFINNNQRQKEKKIYNRATGTTEFSALYLQNTKRNHGIHNNTSNNINMNDRRRKAGKNEFFNNQTKAFNINQGNIKNSENKQNDRYTSMPAGGSKTSSKWKFKDLKNKKQTGDLYRKILHFYKKNESKVFNFASSRSGEGVTTILANLLNYVRNHETNKKIITIDANLQSPNLHNIFSIPNRYGLIDIFNNKIGINEAAIPISPNLYVLTCGKDAHKVSGNLNQENFMKLLYHYRQFYDYIFIDCPPIVSSADALSVAPAADISFIIIHSAKVQRAVAEKAKSLLEDNECQIGGAVLNHVQHVIPSWLYRFI